MAQAVRSRSLTATELVEHHVRHIESLDGGSDGGINAVVVRLFEAARARAAEADAAITKGELWGPLHGVPITLKEVWWLEGAAATSGAPQYKDFVATSNAPIVQRLLDAGAIVLGKTNNPYMTTDWQSYNEIYGTTRNPWDLEQTAGGSSGGSAAAVAAGFAAFDIGSDIAGSIRIPAHFCGCCGHKPSNGIVCFAGHFPGSNDPLLEPTAKPARNRPDPSFYHRLEVAGPLARSCSDLELALRVIVGPDPLRERSGWRFEPPPARVTEAAALRVAVWADDAFCPVQAECTAMIVEVGRRLQASGAHVDYGARPGREGGATEFFAASHEGYAAVLAATLRARTAEGMLHKDYDRARLTRQRCKEVWSRFFAQGSDVLLCPVSPTTAFRHDHSGQPEQVPCADATTSRTIEVNGKSTPYWHQNRWAGLATFADLPSTVVPIGHDARGLPCGVQIVGAPFQDLQTIEVGKMLERLGFGFDPPPCLGTGAVGVGETPKARL